jgi:MHS family proline/betaine transporter-like MFS transporter
MLLGLIAGTFAAATLVSILQVSVSATALSGWVWRIPFIVSLLLGVIALLVRRSMKESTAFEELRGSGRVERSPIREVLRRERRAIVVVALLAVATNAAFYLMFTYSSAYFQTEKLLDGTQAAFATVAALGLTGLAIPFWARLSDRFGRRPIMIIGNAAFVVLVLPMYLLMAVSPMWAVVALVVLGQIFSHNLSRQMSALPQQFPPARRVSPVGRRAPPRRPVQRTFPGPVYWRGNHRGGGGLGAGRPRPCLLYAY